MFSRHEGRRPAPPLLAGTALAAVLGSPFCAWAEEAREPVAAEVVVTETVPQPEGAAEDGYRTSSARVGPLGAVSLKDTPYSLNVTSGELIENSNAHTLADALKTNPTVSTLLNSNGVNSLTRMMIRGFTAADQGELRDGLVDRSFTFPPMEIVERVEVLNGFSGFLNGFGAAGGTINFISKQPTEQPLLATSAGVYGGGIAYGQVDAGGHVAATGNKVGYRFNAYKEGGDTWIDGGTQRRDLVSGVVDVHLAPDTVAKADFYHQNYEAKGLQTYFNANGNNWSGNHIAVPDASIFDPSKQYGEDWAYNKSEKTVAGIGLESRLNETFTFRGAYRHGFMWRQDSYINAILTNNSGNYFKRATIEPVQTEFTNSYYTLMDAKLDSWGVGHDVTFGYTGTDMYYKRGPSAAATSGTTSIYGSLALAQPTVSFGANNNFQRTYNDNFILGDRITLSEQVSLLLGITNAHYTQEAWGSGTTISTSNYKATANTPSVGIVFKPIPSVSTYASYIESLTAGDSTSSATAVNRYQVLSPSVSKQYEIGAKATVGKLDLTAALFKIDKVNAEEDPADHVYKQDGREIHQGVEFIATGKPMDRLTVIGGFTLMDAFVDKAIANPALSGKTPVNVPEKQAKLYVEYEVPFVPDLFLTGGANYYGSRPVDAMNTASMGDAAIFDAGLRYQPEVYGRRVTVNLTATNLFDTAYWSYYRSGDGLALGAPRLFALSVKTEW